MEQSRITNTTIVALIIGLIIGFAGGAYWYKGKMVRSDSANKMDVSENKDDNKVDVMETSSTTEVMEKTEPSTTIVSTVVDTSIVAAPNQKAGDTVLVNKVVSGAEVWVAVREDREGLMGNILGAKKVGAGTSESVVVELLRPTVSNAKYYVVLYRDNGDGAFDSKTDVLVESDGSTIISTFRTQ